MKLAILHELNAERAARRPTILVTDTESGEQRLVKAGDFARDPLRAELEKQLASSELYRDGDKVKETMRAFEDTKGTLKDLYEHWEEAVELN